MEKFQAAAGNSAWEQSIGIGAWAIAARPSDGFVAVTTEGAGNGTVATRFRELSSAGSVISDESIPALDGHVLAVTINVNGQVGGIGTYPADGVAWSFAWDPAGLEALGGGAPVFAIASARDGEFLVAQQLGDDRTQVHRGSTPGGGLEVATLDGLAGDIARDCADGVVAVGGSAVARLDDDGNLLWTATLQGNAISVATDDVGDVYVLSSHADNGQTAMTTKLAGL